MPIDVLKQYSLPINNSLYGKPPLIYKEAETILIPFMSEPKVISELVPKPMEYEADGLVTAQFNRYNAIGAGRSIEIFLNIPVNKTRMKPDTIPAPKCSVSVFSMISVQFFFEIAMQI